MENKNTILITGGQAEPNLLSTLGKYYSQQGWSVYFSQETEYHNMAMAIDDIITGEKKLNAFIYISPPPRQGSMLDDDEHIIAETMNDDLERGLWWVQNACKKMVQQGVQGRVVTLAHIAALVPTEYYSYGAASQLALMNICRSGIQELVPYGIKINTIFRGFSEDDPQQKAFVEQLKQLHKDDGIPLLEYVNAEEIAKTSMLLTDPDIHSFNGAMLTLDGGFYVTRKIRYLDPVRK